MSDPTKNLPWTVARGFMHGTGHWAWYVRDSEDRLVAAFQINESHPDEVAEALARMVASGSQTAAAREPHQRHSNAMFQLDEVLEDNEGLRKANDGLAATLAARDAELASVKAECERLKVEAFGRHSPWVVAAWVGNLAHDMDRRGWTDAAKLLRENTVTLTTAKDELDAFRTLAGELAAACKNLLSNPHGCPFCDSGVLRKRVDGKSPFHTDDCPFFCVAALLEKQ